IDTLSRAFEIDEALSLLEQYERNNPAYLNMYTCILSAARIQQNTAIVEDVYERMKKRDDVTKADLYAALILVANTYASQGNYEKANELRREFVDKENLKKPPGLTWTMVDGIIHEFTAHDRRHPRTSEIYAELDKISQELKEDGHVYSSSWLTKETDDMESVLCGHSEKLAIAFNLIATPSGETIQIIKNLRICDKMICVHRSRQLLLKFRSITDIQKALLSLTRQNFAVTAPSAETAAPTAQSSQLMHNKSKTSLRGTPYKVADIETCLRYIESDAYTSAYGDQPVWKNYVRNRIRSRFPHYTRDFCSEEGLYIRGNPCPICRDEYLLLDYRNIKLLKQFINKHTGEIEPVLRTHICQAQLRNLRVALKKAYDFGLISYEVPFRQYNYKDYYEQLKDKQPPPLLLTILQTSMEQNITNLDELSLSDKQIHQN
ncbi:unnamed protein product, partial [Didymodactylos carnosus]